MGKKLAAIRFREVLYSGNNWLWFVATTFLDNSMFYWMSIQWSIISHLGVKLSIDILEYMYAGVTWYDALVNQLKAGF